ncbi:transketolase [Candidatus Woesebacteria bacterium RBG_16_36_11]|uniref:Transketolase n=3 Tax=Candidatus Woeseibacteriota TaxID=1752722 RepID=A0A1F7X7R9_9BACT|nr:MAG: transketolase [Candidatus Woesebacteria bacterium RBG_13_36_22]OGM11112.1 MAG: transketolase [Candidatus Woesebacteria bacterium RBG_16_36_11]OGM16598.1 MAG: transketolase [Candidatus Woesebacteria bacterium RBG_19FT_COMBO_37_29]
MINPKSNLVKDLFLGRNEKLSFRDALGEALVELGASNEKIFVLSSDVALSTKASYFAQKFPDRFVQVGVAEQVLACIASGIANYGKIPFICAYAVFSPGRNWEQIRTTIALNNFPVKIIGTHAGLNVGAGGSTHQALEDLALMRVLPNMVVIAPCDSLETRKAVMAVADNNKPSYIRIPREPFPQITTSDSPFKIGNAEIFWEDKDPQVAIIACGPLVYEALKAAKELAKSKIPSIVVNCHTIKPLDQQTLIHVAKLTGAIVTAEEHQISGGLGSAVAEVLTKNFPVPIEFIGMLDLFGESGKPEELMQKYQMKAPSIISAAKKVIKRKNS